MHRSYCPCVGAGNCYANRLKILATGFFEIARPSGGAGLHVAQSAHCRAYRRNRASRRPKAVSIPGADPRSNRQTNWCRHCSESRPRPIKFRLCIHHFHRGRPARRGNSADLHLRGQTKTPAHRIGHLPRVTTMRSTATNMVDTLIWPATRFGGCGPGLKSEQGGGRRRGTSQR